MAKSKHKATFAVLSLSTIALVLYVIHSINSRHLRFQPVHEIPEVCLDQSTPKVALSKIIHQSWKSSHLPPIFVNMSATWKSCYPSWSHMLWTDEDNLRLVQKHFAWFLPRYQTLPDNIMRADAARYMYMYVYGGIYADLDTECLKPFPHLLRNFSLVLGAMTGEAILPEGHTQNSFLYSTPRHPFWLQLLKYIYKHPNQGRPETITGPDALMECVQGYRSVCKDVIRVYPPSYFNPFSWLKPPSECTSRLRMTPSQFVACRKKFSDAYVLQYHAHSWE